MEIKRQTRRLYAFGLAACLRIPDAVWVVLLTARGYALWQVGLAEGIFHAVSLLAEIPSGMLADLIGRRRSLALAGLCGVVSALAMAFSRSFGPVCLSMAFSALSCSFISGSDEALLYDSLVQTDQEQRYLTYSARYTQMQNLGTLLSNAASVLASVMSYVGFYLLDALVSLVRVGTALSLTEPQATQKQAARTAAPFAALGQRFREHLALSVGFLRQNPRIGLVLLADSVLSLPSYLTLMFLQQRLSELGVPTAWLGLPVMLIAAGRMAGVALAERLHPARLRSFYVVLALVVGGGTVCAGAAPLGLAVPGAVLAAGAMDTWVLHEQRYLNARFPSDQRATLISVNAMAYSLLMIAASPLVGWVGDLAGSAGVGLCLLGAVVAAAGLGAGLTLLRRPRR